MGLSTSAALRDCCRWSVMMYSPVLFKMPVKFPLKHGIRKCFNKMQVPREPETPRDFPGHAGRSHTGSLSAPSTHASQELPLSGIASRAPAGNRSPSPKFSTHSTAKGIRCVFSRCANTTADGTLCLSKVLAFDDEVLCGHDGLGFAQHLLKLREVNPFRAGGFLRVVLVLVGGCANEGAVAP